jgi:hypothetical protein
MRTPRNSTVSAARTHGVGDGNRTGMTSLEDRGWIMALTSKMLTCEYPAIDDWSDRH